MAEDDLPRGEIMSLFNDLGIEVPVYRDDLGNQIDHLVDVAGDNEHLEDLVNFLQGIYDRTAK